MTVEAPSPVTAVTAAPERTTTILPHTLAPLMALEVLAPPEPAYMPQKHTDIWGPRERHSRGSVYVAGPMRGYIKFNFPAFDFAAALLRWRGWTVLNPAEHDRTVGFDENVPLEEQPEFDLTRAFRWDIQSLLEVDAVYFLKGWEASQGANTEHAIAISLGLQRIYEVPRDDVEYLYLPHIAYRRNEQ